MNLFFVLLVLVGLCLTTIGFTNADSCTSDPVITNGVLDSEISSRDTGAVYTFTCDGTLEDTGTVTCNDNGDWTNSWTCEECYLQNKYVSLRYTRSSVSSEAECEQNCIAIGCGTYRYQNSGTCYAFSSNTIFRDTEMTLQQCIDKCNEMDECLTVRHRILRNGDNLCFLFDVTVPELLALGHWFRTYNGCTVIGKRSTCPQP